MQMKFKSGNKEEYEIDDIWNSMIYAKKLAKQLLGLYYLIL